MALGIGYGNHTNALVSIDKTDGTVTLLIPFDINCAVYLESSVVDAVAGIFYAWLGCGTQAKAQLVAFEYGHPGQKGMRTIVEVGYKSVASPCAVVPSSSAPGIAAQSEQAGTWYGVGANGTLVTATSGGELRTVSSVLPGIPSNNGIVTVQGSSSFSVAVILVQGERASLARVDPDSGSVSTLPMAYPFGNAHFYHHHP